jgi:hypothetical protein
MAEEEDSERINATPTIGIALLHKPSLWRSPRIRRTVVLALLPQRAQTERGTFGYAITF